MGEAAEMVLDGILDWDGTYSGNADYRAQNLATCRRNQRVRDFMRCRGLTTPHAQRRALRKYGESVSYDRPTFHACNNWKVFTAFINLRVSYVKPSKKENND